jgi:hypothetical protein
MSNCLVLRETIIADAIQTGLPIETFVSYDFGHLPGEGELLLSMGIALSIVTDYAQYRILNSRYQLLHSERVEWYTPPPRYHLIRAWIKQ